jgi:hypothetical protein
MKKLKVWNGKDLKGEWEVSLKIDGVCMLRDEDSNPVSRKGKPLYNLQNAPEHITCAEIFRKDWETSVSMVRTHDAEPVSILDMYSLDPIDPRLSLSSMEDPSAETIQAKLESAVANGYEGLVLRQGDKWLKVKASETHDVEVLSMIEGTGKYKCMMGALMTPMGKVGTGFSDIMRATLWSMKEAAPGSVIGQTIEVECMSITKDGKFRHPRFKRVRWDK